MEITQNSSADDTLVPQTPLQQQPAVYDLSFLQTLSGMFPEQISQFVNQVPTSIPSTQLPSFLETPFQQPSEQPTTSQTLAHYGQQMLELDRKKAQFTIQQALSSARAVRQQLEMTLLSSGPIHPYERLIYDYLGPNFICPKITDLELPSNFSTKQTMETLEQISTQCFQKTLTHFQYVTGGIGKEGCEDDTFLMKNLGNFFSTLSTTDKGIEFVEDKAKTAEYISFSETVRNIPADYIINNPVDAAQRLLNQFIKIHSM